MNHHIAMFGSHWSIAIADITYVICHMTLQDHVIWGSFDFVGGSSLLNATTLPHLVAIGIALVQI